MTNQIYVANQTDGTVTVINGATNGTSTVTVGSSPVAVAVNPITNLIYVANSGSDTVTAINGATDATTTVSVGSAPSAISVDQAANKIYVTNGGNGTEHRNRRREQYDASGSPEPPVGIAADPVTGKAFAANHGNNNVTALPLRQSKRSRLPPRCRRGRLRDHWRTGDICHVQCRSSFHQHRDQQLFAIAPPPPRFYYQLDTAQGMWQAATETSGAGANPASFSFRSTVVPVGVHILYAFAAFGDESGCMSNSSATAPATRPGRQRSRLVFAEFPAPSMTALSLAPSTVSQGSAGPVVMTATVTASAGRHFGEAAFSTCGSGYRCRDSRLAAGGTSGGAPSGKVTFFNDGALLGSAALSGGTATLDYNPSSLAVGAYSITAIYSGDTTFGTSSGTQILTVTSSGTEATTTALSLSPSSVDAGSSGPVVMTATVAAGSGRNYGEATVAECGSGDRCRDSRLEGGATPTGSVTFFNGTQELGTAALSGGTAIFNYNPSGLAAGIYSITAIYSGDSTFAGSTSPPQSLTVISLSPVQFVPVTPCRVVDTRNANGPFGGPAISGGTSRSFAIPYGPCAGIPTTAVAYSLNVTVVPDGPLGYLTIWPTGEGQPMVSTLNSLDGRIKANAAIVPAGTHPEARQRVCQQHHQRGAGHQRLLRGQQQLDAGVLSADAVPRGRHAQEHRDMPSGLGAPSLVAGTERDFPILERLRQHGSLRYSLDGAGVFAELHGGAAGGGDPGLSDGVAAGRDQAAGFHAERSDGNDCGQCGHRAGGHGRRRGGVSEQRHRPGD